MLRFDEYVEAIESDVETWIAMAKSNASHAGAADRDQTLAQHLVFMWEKHPHPDIEKELLAIPGIKKIGEKGESVSFVGRLHKGPGLFQDDPAIITRPGWLIMDEKGEYMLGKALAVPSD